MPITDTKFRPQMPMAKSYIVEFNGNQYGHIAELKPGTKGKAKQEDVIGSWYAWVDIDPPPEIVADLLNLTEEERREITARFADEVCKVLEVTDLPPSCILFSGRGVWMFWRLDICLPANEIQDLNRRLEQHIEDLLEVLKVPANVDTCSNADRIARWPGSINRKTGLKAEWIHQEDHAHAYDPDDLLRHLPAPKFKTHTASNLEARFEETIDPNDGDEFEVEDLSGRVLDYFTGAATSDGSDDFQSAVTWAVSRGKSYNSVLSAFEALQNETGKADYQGELGGAGARFLAQGRLEQQLQISWMKAIDFLDRESGEFDPGSNDLGETQTGPGDDGEIVREPSPFVYCGELLNSKPPTYLVEGLILKGAVGALVGPSQTFKSFIAMNLAWSLAAGLAPYPGARAEQAEVLYIAGEGQADLPARYQAFLAHNDLHFFDVEFHALPEPRYLNDPKVVRALVNGVRRITPIEKHLFVVVDTMSANFSGKENSDEAADFIRGCQTIARECNATVMFVHHLGKDESKGPRGHTSIFANSDFVLDVKRV
ncbi:MAG: AAA family ATPase, partial [Pseudomonadota bacterium]